MDWYQSTNAYPRASRQHQILDAVVAYRYFAPGKLALDEAHERMLAEAALCRLLEGTEPTAGQPRLMNMVRRRLGGLLIRIGTRLQGTPSVKTTVPTASDPGPAVA